MSVSQTVKLSRRAFGRVLATGSAALGFAPAAVTAAPTPDPALRDAALRGLALAGYRGDPITAKRADEAIIRLAETDPEGALLARLYRAADVRPAGTYWVAHPAAAEQALSVLHAAIAAAQPVAFAYTDQSDQRSERVVLPLALVHPPQGVKLMAWCELRQGYRQFFVREMTDLSPRAGDFSAQRLTLLQGLVEKERA